MEARPHLQMVMSLNAAVAGAARAGVSVHVHWECQESFIQRARNNAVARMLGDERFAGCTHLLTWDSDVGCDMRGGTVEDNPILRLLADDLDVVGGLYACKSKECRCSSVPDAGGKVSEGADYLVKMRWLSTGLMLVRRGVLERMAKEPRYFESEVYDGDGDMAGKEIVGVYNAFIVNMADGRRKLLSEDWSFCERLRGMGVHVWADVRIPLAHIGQCEYRL
jgi:hypothetical protein